jgi:flagellar basal-body rod protein FlgB
MSNPISDSTLGQLHRTLGQTALRAAVSASNLANVDTPGYRALAAQFPETLADAGLEPLRTAPGHLGALDMGSSGATLVEAPSARMRMDGNTVDVDVEMTQLGSFQGRYGAAVQMVRKRFALMRLAVTDGRG